MSILDIFKGKNKEEIVSSMAQRDSLFRIEYVIVALNDKNHGDITRAALVKAVKTASEVITLMGVKEKLEHKDYLALSITDIEREESIDEELRVAQKAAYHDFIKLNSIVKNVEGVPEKGIIPFITDDSKELITDICYDMADAIYEMSRPDEL